MSGRKTFVAGEVLQAADVNDYLMDQSVMVFAGTAARGSAIPSPSEGMVTYLEDADELQVYTTAWGGVGGGKILQLVSATHSTTVSTTSTSFVTTNLSASITPSETSSKVLVLSSGAFGNSSVSASCIVTLFRGTVAGTNLGNGANGMAFVYSAAGASRQQVGLSFLDSPNTTSAQTYTVGFRANAAFTAIAQHDSALSSLVLVEVAG